MQQRCAALLDVRPLLAQPLTGLSVSAEPDKAWVMSESQRPLTPVPEMGSDRPQEDRVAAGKLVAPGLSSTSFRIRCIVRRQSRGKVVLSGRSSQTIVSAAAITVSPSFES